MRSAANGFLAAAQVVATCFMTWKALCLWTGTPYPIMIVTTESMLPAFAVGDVLLISNHDRKVEIGDLPVCWLPNREFPMVHRVHRVMYPDEEGNDLGSLHPQQFILTKGDNNLIDDMLLYPDGQDYLTRDEVLGFVRGYVPFIGWIVLVLQDFRRLGELATIFWPGVSRLTS
ncbi:hypothetical protein BJY04DRAFT_222881 [Aspergillus karnatakaensis]|uniref:uncharacterized protein n=1 Tax=Aspergillus karnatakaensis TaxID=1810916 RepID=UPI003CCDDB89